VEIAGLKPKVATPPKPDPIQVNISLGDTHLRALTLKAEERLKLIGSASLADAVDASSSLVTDASNAISGRLGATVAPANHKKEPA
jgi:hypothetical protein